MPASKRASKKASKKSTYPYPDLPPRDPRKQVCGLHKYPPSTVPILPENFQYPGFIDDPLEFYDAMPLAFQEVYARLASSHLDTVWTPSEYRSQIVRLKETHPLPATEDDTEAWSSMRDISDWKSPWAPRPKRIVAPSNANITRPLNCEWAFRTWPEEEEDEPIVMGLPGYSWFEFIDLDNNRINAPEGIKLVMPHQRFRVRSLAGYCNAVLKSIYPNSTTSPAQGTEIFQVCNGHLHHLINEAGDVIHEWTPV